MQKWTFIWWKTFRSNYPFNHCFVTFWIWLKHKMKRNEQNLAWNYCTSERCTAMKFKITFQGSIIFHARWDLKSLQKCKRQMQDFFGTWQLNKSLCYKRSRRHVKLLMYCNKPSWKMVKYIVQIRDEMATLLFKSCLEITFPKVCIRFFPQMLNLNMLLNFLQAENKYINLVNLFAALCIQFPQLTSAHLPFFPIVIWSRKRETHEWKCVTKKCTISAFSKIDSKTNFIKESSLQIVHSYTNHENVGTENRITLVSSV